MYGRKNADGEKESTSCFRTDLPRTVFRLEANMAAATERGLVQALIRVLGGRQREKKEDDGLRPCLLIL
jgi:hypothetical protein